jgi:hypothetical protein
LEKWCKIAALALNDEEWTCVHLFCNILQVRLLLSTSSLLLMCGLIQYTNDAQQVFSSSSTLSLQNALPALERLHMAWEKASSKSQYSCFILALDAGMAKLNQYYQCSAELDAHILAMGEFSFPLF